MFSIEREGNWYNNVPDVVATIKFYNDQLAKLWYAKTEAGISLPESGS